MDFLKTLPALLLMLLLGTGSIAQSTHQTKNMIVILIDGYRWQELFKGADSSLLHNQKYNPANLSDNLGGKYWSDDAAERKRKLMPFVWNYISKHGQLYGNRDLGNKVNVQNPYWFSYPGRAEMLSGFVDTAINSNEYPDNSNPNVLEYINKQQDYHGHVATFACWRATGRCLHANNSDMMVNVPWQDITGKLTETEKLANEMQHLTPQFFGDDERLDVNVYSMAKAYIMAAHPKVIYLDFGDPDEYAHGNRYESYLDEAHHLDSMIGILWNTVQADPFYKGNTTLFVMPDHGRGMNAQWTDHGAETPHSNETWLMVMGPDTKPLGEISSNEQIYQTQIAQTIANFLGFDYNPQGHTVGNSIKSVMK